MNLSLLSIKEVIMAKVTERNVWKCLSTDEDLLGTFSEKDFLEVKALAHKVWMKFNDEKLHLLALYMFVKDSVVEGDEDALTKALDCHPEREALNLIHVDDDEGLSPIIWKKIKPKGR